MVDDREAGSPHRHHGPAPGEHILIGETSSFVSYPLHDENTVAGHLL